MKVPEEYGGLGLSQVYYNRALALAGVLALVALHPALGPPVDRPGRAAAAVRLRGAEAGVAAQGGARTTSRRSCSPSPTWARTPPAWAPPPPPPRTARATCINGQQAVGHQRRDRRRRGGHGQGAEARGQQGRHQRVHPALRLARASRSKHRNAVHGPARHRELGDRCSRTSSCPKENLIGEGGPGPEDRPGHAQHRPPRAAGDLRRRGQVGHQGRARVGRRARAVGPAGRQARGRGAEDRVPRRHARSASRPCSTCPAAWPTTRSNDIRIEAALAKLYASELGWQVDRRADADPRRPRLRDGRVAEGPRREAGAGRAGAARHAHQPHLRGLHGDHAPAHRPRGGGPAPGGGRRHPRARRRAEPTRPRPP